MQNRDVSIDEGDTKTLKQVHLVRASSLIETHLRSGGEGVLRLWQVTKEVMRSCSQADIPESDDGDKLSLAIERVVDKDLLHRSHDLWHPLKDFFSNRIGKIGNETTGHSGAHRIAVLHLHGADEILNELWQEGRNTSFDSRDDSVEDE